MDKNEYKKSYRPCMQHWKFITMQTKKLTKYYLSSNYNNPVLKLCIISLDIINHYENTGPNIGE